MIVFGLIMMAVMLIRPQGIWGQTKAGKASIDKILLKAKGGVVKDVVRG